MLTYSGLFFRLAYLTAIRTNNLHFAFLHLPLLLHKRTPSRQKKSGALPKFCLDGGTAKNLARNTNLKVRRVDN